jgi:RNA polymerase sigma factor (sigma-70 family)
VTCDARLTELERVYRSSLPSFVRVAAAVTGERALGDDAVHDAFVACVRGLSGFRGESAMEAWVWRAVVNSALLLRRRRIRERKIDERQAAASRHENGTADQLGRVRLAVALLPERQRLAIFLRYYADLDYGAIAEALDVSSGTVGAALNQAHASLRAALTKETSDE